MSKPEKIIMVGPCRAAIFRNQVMIFGKQIIMPKVKFEVRYKDKRSGKWKGTSCMTIHELPKAILALQKAYEYLTTRKSASQSVGESNPQHSTLIGSYSSGAIDPKGAEIGGFK